MVHPIVAPGSVPRKVITGDDYSNVKIALVHPTSPVNLMRELDAGKLALIYILG